MKLLKLGAMSDKAATVFFSFMLLFVWLEKMYFDVSNITFTTNTMLTVWKLNHNIIVPIIIVLFVRSIAEVVYKLLTKK